MNTYLPGYAAAYAWLARDIPANLELLLGLLHEPLDELVVVGGAPHFTGVLMRGPHPTHRGACFRLDAADDAALAALLAQQRPQQRGFWLVHRPHLAAALHARRTLRPTGMRLQGYARRTPTTHPCEGRALAPDDATLVARSKVGWDALHFQRMFPYGRQPWAILRDDRIVCRAAVDVATPWSAEVIAVWTHPAYRNQGLAQRLVASVCNTILQHHSLASYVTTNDNHASQWVARKVGFAPVWEMEEFMDV